MILPKTALITGGNSGIGLAVVHRLAAAGTQVVVLDQDIGNLSAFAGVRAVRADVRDKAAVEAAVTDAYEASDPLEALVNCVGIEHVAALADQTDEDWDTVFDINTKSYMQTIRACLPYFATSGACVVNVASQLALAGTRRFSAYTASKAAILGLTRSLALELAADQIRVNVVCPGATDTPLLRRQFQGGEGPQGSIDDLVGMHPLGRLATPDDVAGPIVFLTSRDSGFMTGSTVVVDGGYTAW